MVLGFRIRGGFVVYVVYGGLRRSDPLAVVTPWLGGRKSL